ncbi:uncharacterized protein LOC103308082 [Acyrthosiphon pisum]|uniref:Uncharacterized protein n=1 Tax=Acyrthosiphon pisum TaxID=7029 RepID=A0A8R2B2P1_ACYPI|nr:uncharacterized protein LOC103308082 [Acyrthosiphon pisum]|eukprot:XP_008179037.1 PREDICTED: uncharacterized protein LOC103308082 [Acyrthosiphon pisum]
MIKKSNKKFEDLEVGVNVRVSIPDVDRARGLPRNVLAAIISIEDNMYKLGTENGILKHLYTRTEIFLYKEKFILLENVLKLSAEKEITFREAAGVNSVMGTQGFQRCHCKTKCKTTKCTCRSNNRLYTWKCHNSLSCENK